MATIVQILPEDICILDSANILGIDMHSTILSPTKDK